MDKINVDDVKSRVDIVDIIDGYIPLKKTGKNYQACCPFHTEKSPSFTVSQDKQFYHCFGCGAHGDVIGFVQDYLNIEFIEVIKVLGGEITSTPTKSIKQRQVNRVRLPLDKQPHNTVEMQNFINKCELVSGFCFYNQHQVYKLTDINNNWVSLALYDGLNVSYFNKEFLHGSCVIFGDIQSSNSVILCDNLRTSLKISNQQNSAVICFFIDTNIHYISESIKRMKRSIIVASSNNEITNRADDLNLQYKKIRMTK